MSKFITFNTLSKAQHYVKHLNARRYNDPSGEQFTWYTIKDNMVLNVWGWRCGCGCDRGHTDATVIGRIKSPLT